MFSFLNGTIGEKVEEFNKIMTKIEFEILEQKLLNIYF